MGYKSDVRIITSKDGFEILKEFVKKYLKEHNEDYNLLEKCDIKQEGKEQYYFGWNYIKWYENDYKDVDAIMEGLNYLGEKEYSYRYMRIGESYDDFEEQYYDGQREEKMHLEFPCVTRAFDDEYLLGAIKGKRLENEAINKEELDI